MSVAVLQLERNDVASCSGELKDNEIVPETFDSELDN